MNDTFLEENEIVFVSDDPFVSYFAADAEGSVELVQNDEGYAVKLNGVKGEKYQFSITDDEAVYEFEFYYDDASRDVVVERR